MIIRVSFHFLLANFTLCSKDDYRLSFGSIEVYQV